MRIVRERYFSIETPNKPGILASIGAALMNAQVDCSSIWGTSPRPDLGAVMVVPRSPDRFRELAKKEKWKFHEGLCFLLEGQDKTGALVQILSQLASDGISITMLDAMAVEGKFGCHLWVNDEEIEHVAQVLGLSTPKP